MVWLWAGFVPCKLEIIWILKHFAVERNERTLTKGLLFSGYCHFENGLCGLTSENSTEFQWSTGSGKTPSENTGPAFDHTTFTNKGTCTSIRHLAFLHLEFETRR